MKAIYWLVIAAVVAGGAVAAWKYWPKPATNAKPTASSPVSPAQAEAAHKTPAPPPEKPAPKPTDTPAVKPSEQAPPPVAADPPPAPKATSADAAAMLAEARELLNADKLVEARAKFSQAYNTGALNEADASATRKALFDLADKTIFSSTVFPGDPYCEKYVFKPGEVLARVERTLALRVPTQIILRINNIGSASTIRAGQSIKVIHGPFRAVVYKSKFVMDLYLQDTLVRQFRVGIGSRETPTPEGHFRVTLAGKLMGATYNPPPSSGLAARSLRPGDPGYPLDSRGHWISLTGIPEKGTNLTDRDGYGIHGTCEPGSIGTASSHGCVRLSDADIELVFALLYEYHSAVDILP